MLTKRQNMHETITHGHPDRFVNQYEAMAFVQGTPYDQSTCEHPPKGGPPVQNAWGVWLQWSEGQPGPFPLHDPEHLLVPDITEWQSYVKAPRLDFPAEDWEPVIQKAEAVDRNEQYVTAFVFPGIFERLHYFQGMMAAMVNFLEEPEATKELIDFLTEWELEYAALLCKYIKPDCLFHHDDWGSQNSTFLAPDMFDEFILPAYKKVYGYYKDHGVEIIVHHSDSYGATLVPEMIELGIDVWQGCLHGNDIPARVEQYVDKITFMGGIDSAYVDKPDWSEEETVEVVRRICTEIGPTSYIPCLTQGAPVSSFRPVYPIVTETIEQINHEVFGI